MKRVGLFGGTFDPIHTGHLIIVQAVYEKTGLDSVVFIPSANPPHKEGPDIMFTPEERYSMISAAICGNPHFEVSDIEMKRTGPSYTIDTIREFKASGKTDIDLAFIVGRDNLYEISSWKDPLSIIRECRIIVAERPYHDTREIPGWLSDHIEIVSVPLVDISSTVIRSRIREGKSIRYMVPGPVADAIEHKLGMHGI
ncbi:nicotinate-nucleotide adenylyltransferase [bacterium]|nr:nicotinate-nucleotide adenylyltransferase [bacterium]